MSQSKHHSDFQFLSGNLLVIALLALLGQFSSVQASDLTPSSVLKLINEERLARELAPLKENAILTQAAEAKAKDMLKNGYFSHNSPKGENPWYWLKQSGYSYQYAGENLAINYESAESQHSAWMKSATHQANIVNTKYQETGIAIVSGKMKGESATITVQFFGAPRGALSPQSKPIVSAEVPTLKPVPAVLPASDVMPTTLDRENIIPQGVETPTSDSDRGWATPWTKLEQWLAPYQTLIRGLATLLILSVAVAVPAVFVSEAGLILWRHFGIRTKHADSAV